ncbi:MAG TPA: mandelate racemase/muconate lactonizing enzyme family protein [Myxococcaceae bacterium]|nr:mandelate racemase/muconate lactonizing enzyme family protein [Myxococcaceae bacterium]
MTTELLVRPRTLRFRSMVLSAAGMRTGVEGFWLRLGDGLGEVTLLPGFGTEPPEKARAALADAASALRGTAPPLSAEDVANRIKKIPILHEAPATRAGVELALLDSGARHAGVPLSTWLGSEPRSVRVNALLIDDEVDALVSEARARAHENFDTLKIKVGVATAEHDAARLNAVRAAVGPNVRIRVDGNAAWSEGEARTRLEAFAAARLEYVEQPVAANDFECLRRLRSLARIAADESIGVPGAREGLFGGKRPAVDVLVFKLPVVGGVLRARRYAALAWEQGVEVVVTSAMDGAVSRAGAAHLASTLPLEGPAHGLATGHILESDEGGYAISHGLCHLPDLPGLGIDPQVLGW